jgi:ATP-dependent DNA helicase RecG
MLIAKTYEAVKTAVDYTKDKSIQSIKAKETILEYIRENDSITNEKTRELCGFTKQQARMPIAHLTIDFVFPS